MKNLHKLSFGLSICAIFAFVSVVSSCSNEEDVSPDPQSLSGDSRANDEQQLEEMRAAAKKLLWYLDLEDGCRYVVTISQSEAERLLGVNKAQYEAVVADFNQVNRLTQIELEKAKTIPNYEVIINTPEELIAANNADIAVRATAVPPSSPIHGSISCGGQQTTEKRLFAPSWLKGIRFFVMLTGGTGQQIVCSTYALGQWDSRSVVGSSMFNRTVEVPVAGNNCNISIYLGTGGTFGAFGSYDGYGEY